MTKMYSIGSVDDIKNFVYELTSIHKKEIYPEADFSELVSDEGKPLFTMEEANYYDDLMLNCFVFCADHRLDLHDICADVWRDYKRSQANVFA